MSTLSVSDGSYVLGGSKFRMISGAIHYFRILPVYWPDRLVKTRLCGLNTVETYIPWNMHEPKPGEYCFSGRYDLESFIEQVADAGLHLIIRPGPYICAEWEFGGLPSWLLKERSTRLRCMHRPYLDAVDRYFDELIPRLARYQSCKGGPIIAVQVENEYGSYGSDTEYLRHLRDGLIDRGIEELLFTSDGPTQWMLNGGTIPDSPGSDVLPTVNFGSNATEAFAALQEFTGNSEIPLNCMEFWNGWFDHWGEGHHTRAVDDAAAALEEILEAGASVNFYMFSGGTNFGFSNGSNYAGRIQPTITSYDYDAALGETGEPTDKFHAFRSVISRYAPVPDEVLPPAAPRQAYGKVSLSKAAGLFENLDAMATNTCSSPVPLTMEEMDQDYGFILYRTEISGPREEGILHLQEVHDRALVYLDGAPKGIIDRDDESSIRIGLSRGETARLDILVENLGRINYGPLLADRKGITEGIRLGNQFLYDWDHFSLPMDPLPQPIYRDVNAAAEFDQPLLYKGGFGVDAPVDTFLDFAGWTKGVCFINGINIGRYWNIGPQRTLYVPGALLKQGENEVVMFELHGTTKPELPRSVRMIDTHDLG